jgi:hypothetical protein
MSARIIKEIETVQTASRSQSTHLSEVEDEMLQLKEEQQEYDTEQSRRKMESETTC